MDKTIKNYQTNIKHKMNLKSFFITIFLHPGTMQDDFFIFIRQQPGY